MHGMNPLFRFLRPLSLIMREGENEGGSGGGEGGDGGQQSGGDTGGGFFKPDTGGDGGDGGDQGQQQQQQQDDGRPDWLLQKYNSVEDQAKAYNDLFRSYSRKTDDLRAEVTDSVREEVRNELMAESGRPEKAEDYAYPEGINPPTAEGLDEGLRNWAHEHGVSGEAFQSLINDVWMKTQPNPEQELALLGDNASERVNTLNRWLTKNVDEAHHGALSKMLTTAASIELMESMAALVNPSFAPQKGDTPRPKALTRDEIRAKQADPRFGNDEAYTAEVRADWKRFAASQP